MSKTAGGFIHRGNKFLWEPGQVRESKLEVVGFTISMAILIMKNTNIYIYMYVHKKKTAAHTDTHKEPVIVSSVI